MRKRLLSDIETIQQFALQHFGEKTLGEILSVRCSAIPAQAHIFVNGLPVRLAQCAQRSLALPPSSLRTPAMTDHRVAGKRSSPPVNSC